MLLHSVLCRVRYPGDYTTPQWGTKTSDSRKASSASFCFSKGSERFIDRSGSLSASAYTLTPPPGKYATPVATGTQVSSDKPTRPSCSFSRAAREEGSRDYFGYASPGAKANILANPQPRAHSPGPGAHAPRRHHAVGEQVLSSRPSSANFGFGSSDRFAKQPSGVNVAPGPGTYMP